MECAGQKLAVDFREQSRLRGDMDTTTRAIIVRLCTEAGVRMEDASVLALTISGLSDDELEAALDQLIEPADMIAALIRAARALTE